MPDRADDPPSVAAPFVVTDGSHVHVLVRVVPRAGRTCLDGQRGSALLVRVAAAPTDGAANDALLQLLADSLGVARSTLTLVSGERSRNKKVRVGALSLPEVARRLDRCSLSRRR